MAAEKTRHRGILTTEMVISLTALSILTAGLALSLYGFSRFNRYQLVRQRCTAAAQAQLDSLTVTGQPISDNDFTRLWPGLGVAIEKSEGTGQWQGMLLVQVTTTGKGLRKEVKVKMSRYILQHQITVEPG
jgi:type II secretory pathway pseudopilin PulG